MRLLSLYQYRSVHDAIAQQLISRIDSPSDKPYENPIKYMWDKTDLVNRYGQYGFFLGLLRQRRFCDRMVCNGLLI